MTHPAVDAFRGSADMIRVVGHRGARGLYPENTMLGFEFAIRTGAPLLEFDVVMSADGVPVITHNHTLHAPTFRDAAGRFLTEEPKVADLTWAQLQSYDVGRIDVTSEYGQRFPEQAQLDGVRVPRLTELLALAACPEGAAAQLMLELKSDPDFAADEAYRTRFVETVVAEVRAAGLTARTLLHSFDWRLLATCQQVAPDMPTSFLTQLPSNEDEIGEDSAKATSPDLSGRGGSGRIPEMVAEAGGALWCPYVHDITAAEAVRARALGLVVAVWTVNEPADIDRMIDLQVDAIVTDYPGRVQQHLLRRGLRWNEDMQVDRAG
jgi:glycerophosphoryl diester phosphodiesterase